MSAATPPPDKSNDLPGRPSWPLHRSCCVAVATQGAIRDGRQRGGAAQTAECPGQRGDASVPGWFAPGAGESGGAGAQPARPARCRHRRGVSPSRSAAVTRGRRTPAGVGRSFAGRSRWRVGTMPCNPPLPAQFATHHRAPRAGEPVQTPSGPRGARSAAPTCAVQRIYLRGLRAGRRIGESTSIRPFGGTASSTETTAPRSHSPPGPRHRTVRSRPARAPAPNRRVGGDRRGGGPAPAASRTGGVTRDTGTGPEPVLL